MGLEEILKGIDGKVKQEVDDIEKAAEEERRIILKEAEQKAKERKRDLIEKAKWQIEEEMRRELIKVRREEKKKILTLKSEIMGKAFQEAKDKFLSLKKDDYLSLMKDVLVAGIKRGDEEIVLSPRDKELMHGDFLKEIEKALTAKGQEPNLKFVLGLDEGERGFIIKSEDVQINATFSTLFSLVKDREEIEVGRLLFE